MTQVYGWGAALGLLAAMPAHAQSTIPGPTYYVGQAASLPIPVTASVGGRCGFADAGVPNGTRNVGAIDQAAWAEEFPFVLNCNGASRVAVTSLNGGLKTTVVPGASGYANLAPYTVKLNLVGSGGANVTAECEVGGLKPGATSPCTFIGPASQTVGLRMPSSSQNLTGSYLQARAPAYVGPDVLVQGTYADTLTITVSAAP